MSETFLEASKILNQVTKDFSALSNKLSQVGVNSGASFAEMNKLYSIATELQILNSKLNDEPTVVEGLIEVYNNLGMVKINGIEIRGNIEFEVLINGEWIKGHRTNSQYGQVFNGTILSNSLQGRVHLPLTLDNK